MEAFVKRSVDNIPEKLILLDKLQAIDVKNAILLKTNAQLIANARSKSARSRKQLPTEVRYLSKSTAEILRAEIAQKEAEIEAKRLIIAEKKAITAAKQAEARRTATLRQLARMATVEGSGGGQRQRLPQRSRAQGNYLLWIEEDVFE